MLFNPLFHLFELCFGIRVIKSPFALFYEIPLGKNSGKYFAGKIRGAPVML